MEANGVNNLDLFIVQTFEGSFSKHYFEHDWKG